MHEDLNIQFAARVRASSATLVEVGSLGEVPAVIRNEMQRLQLAGPVVTGRHPVLEALAAGPDCPKPEWACRSFSESDRVALSHALAGIAETGSLALASGTDNPVTLNYLPDLHIILVSATDLLATLDDLWPRLRRATTNSRWPRSINLITGPSRTADVEQTLQLGAHGPRKVLVVQYREPITRGQQKVSAADKTKNVSA